MFDTISIERPECQNAEEAERHVLKYLRQGESGYHGFVDVAAVKRNWVFLVRVDGGVVLYEG